MVGARPPVRLLRRHVQLGMRPFKVVELLDVRPQRRQGTHGGRCAQRVARAAAYGRDRGAVHGTGGECEYRHSECDRVMSSKGHDAIYFSFGETDYSFVIFLDTIGAVAQLQFERTDRRVGLGQQRQGRRRSKADEGSSAASPSRVSFRGRGERRGGNQLERDRITCEVPPAILQQYHRRFLERRGLGDEE